MASSCTLPTPFFTTSRKRPSLIIIHSSSFPHSTHLKSHCCLNFPSLSVSASLHRRRAVPPTDAAVLDSRSGLADRWREIMGSNNWKGLLVPMDPLLRVELLKYGDFAASTYEGFIDDTYSRNYGVGRFEQSEFFDATVMPKHGYQVSNYILCTSNLTYWPPFYPKPINPRQWKQNNIWIGFIAVSDDETSKKIGRRDIMVVWRGTITDIEWQNDFLANSVDLPPEMHSPHPGIKVANGFLSLYTHKDGTDYSARGLVLSEVRRLVNDVYPNEQHSITVIGHSLGGALSTLSAYDIAETRANGNAPVTVITYAGAKVGNQEFVKRVDELGVKVLRIVNYSDWVPTVPPQAYNVGVELLLHNDNSPYLKPLPNILIHPKDRAHKAHDLELYLHLVDGYQGKGKFKLETGRDLNLVNKFQDMLKEEHFVKPKWRVDHNNSMVLFEGSWVHESLVNYFGNEQLTTLYAVDE